MLKGNALRHQMVLPQQQKIYDYWRSKCRAGQFPSRHDILPQDIKSQLPTISLIELDTHAQMLRFKYRLAGTGFWSLFENEITGRYVDDLPLGDRCAYWDRVLNQVVRDRRPTAGVTRPGTPRSGHLAQFWIRLPLSKNGTDIDMILGFDQFMKISDIPNPVDEPQKIFA